MLIYSDVHRPLLGADNKLGLKRKVRVNKF